MYIGAHHVPGGRQVLYERVRKGFPRTGVRPQFGPRAHCWRAGHRAGMALGWWRYPETARCPGMLKGEINKTATVSQWLCRIQSDNATAYLMRIGENTSPPALSLCTQYSHARTRRPLCVLRVVDAPRHGGGWIAMRVLNLAKGEWQHSSGVGCNVISAAFLLYSVQFRCENLAQLHGASGGLGARH